MEHEKNLKNIHKHICLFVDLIQDINWKIWINDFFPFIKALRNQMEQFILCEKYSLEDSEFKEFDNLKDLVLIKILNGIEDEMKNLQILVEKFKSKIEEIKKIGYDLENLTLDIDWHDDNILVKGSVQQSSLEQILEWVLEIILFFDNSLKQLDLNVIDYKDLKSLENYQKSLETFNFKRIEFILGMMKFRNN